MFRTISVRTSLNLLRQGLNVIFVLAQVVVTLSGYITGTNSNFDSREATTPVVPASYAFIIWGVIYAGAIVYAIYQALPRQRENALLRRIGFYTAFAYLATTLWLIAAQNGMLWLTVVFIFLILASLLGAFIQFILYYQFISAAERFLVVLPISVYTGWATVASIANTSTVLQASGFSNVIFPNDAWAIIMLIIGGLIAAFTTFRSRGNIGYALTVIWALIGVAVANGTTGAGAAVATVATGSAVLVALVLLLTRRAADALISRPA